MDIRYRPMGPSDIGAVPMDCHGGSAATAARIADLGAAGMLAFDGEQHVGQLQFRRHDASLRSAAGIWHPDYWGDFGDAQPPLPRETLGLFCYHVGQLTDGEAREARYMGQGIGAGLLDHALAWADAQGFAAVVAKGTPPYPAVMRFMGGQPPQVYAERGFAVVHSWIDAQLHAALVERGLVPAEADPGEVARVSLCVRRLPRGA